MRLHHIRLLVGDMDASIRFYRNTLGFQLTWGEAAIGSASFTGGDGADLSLFARQEQPEATPMPQPATASC
jgi:lactoylglutathione lyase